MAVTFAVSSLDKTVQGNKRVHYGLLTATGTTSDNGDTIAASLFGLSTLDDLFLDASLDSDSNPENAATAKWIKSQGKIAFFGGAAAGSPQAALSDGATVTGYTSRFVAVGK